MGTEGDCIQPKACSDIGYTYMKRTLPSRGSQSSRNQECRWPEAAATIKLGMVAEWAFPEH